MRTEDSGLNIIHLPRRGNLRDSIQILKTKKRVMISLFSYPHLYIPFFLSQTKLNHPPLPDDYFKNSKISSARP